MEWSFEGFIAVKTTSSLLGGGVMRLPATSPEYCQFEGERVINDINRASLRCRDRGKY